MRPTSALRLPSVSSRESLHEHRKHFKRSRPALVPMLNYRWFEARARVFQCMPVVHIRSRFCFWAIHCPQVSLCRRPVSKGRRYIVGRDAICLYRRPVGQTSPPYMATTVEVRPRLLLVVKVEKELFVRMIFLSVCLPVPGAMH